MIYTLGGINADLVNIFIQKICKLFIKKCDFLSLCVVLLQFSLFYELRFCFLIISQIFNLIAFAVR